MIKIIFSDMDGTLLDDASKLPAEFPKVVAGLKRRGVLFAPASGRQYFSLRDTFKEYADEFLFLAENGTLVMYQGKELFSDTVDKELAKAVLFRAAELPGVYEVFCGKKDAYVREEQHTPEFLGELYKYYTHSQSIADFHNVPDEAVKVSLFDPTGQAETTIYETIKREFGDRLQVVLSSAYWVDIMNQHISKGVAVQQVQKRLGVTPDECAAFGDYLNDAQMMEAVTHSFAMANAVPEIKQRARYETASNAEHGVIKGIYRLRDMGLL